MKTLNVYGWVAVCFEKATIDALTEKRDAVRAVVLKRLAAHLGKERFGCKNIVGGKLDVIDFSCAFIPAPLAKLSGLLNSRMQPHTT